MTTIRITLVEITTTASMVAMAPTPTISRKETMSLVNRDIRSPVLVCWK